MNEQSNVVDLRLWPTPVQTTLRHLIVTEYDIRVGDEDSVYTIRRATDRETRWSYLTIKHDGRVILVSRDVPDEYVRTIVGAYIQGRKIGLARGLGVVGNTEERA
jgi:hypothetical protein